VDSEAERDQLNLAHETKTKKCQCQNKKKYCMSFHVNYINYLHYIVKIIC